MRYWELTENERANLAEYRAEQLARQQVDECGDVLAGEHIMEDWWNRRAHICEKQKIANSAMFFSRITGGDVSLIRECLEHTYSPRQLSGL